MTRFMAQLRRILLTGSFVFLKAHAQLCTGSHPCRSDDFVDSIGSAVHFADPPYQEDAEALIRAVQVLGIRHLRDGIFIDSKYQSIHNQLGTLGVRTDYIEPCGNAIDCARDQLPLERTWDKYVTDAEAFEPPNEHDLTAGDRPNEIDPEKAQSWSRFLANARSYVPPGYPFLGPSTNGEANLTSLTRGGMLYTVPPPVRIESRYGSGGSCSVKLDRSPYTLSTGQGTGMRVASCSCQGGNYTSTPELFVGRSRAESPGTAASGATLTASLDSHHALSTCAVNDLTVAAGSWDINNMHYYQSTHEPETSGYGGLDFYGNSYGSLAQNVAANTVLTSHLLLWATEAGYVTSAPNASGLPEAYLATYVPRLLFNNFAHGIGRTYLYQLYDDPISPEPKDGQRNDQYHFGLIRADGSYKPSFLSIASLVHLLQDRGIPFKPTPLHYTVSGDTRDLQEIVLQKHDGTWFLVLWLAVEVYSPQPALPSGSQSAPPIRDLRISLQGRERFQALRRMRESGEFAVSSAGGQLIRLNVNARITVLEIR